MNPDLLATKRKIGIMKKLIFSLFFGMAMSAGAKTSVDITSMLQNPDFESCSYSSWVTDCPGWTFDWNTMSNPWPAKYDGSWEAFSGGNYYMNFYGTTASEGLVISQTITAPASGQYTLTANASVDAQTQQCLSLYLANGNDIVKKPFSIDSDVTYSASVHAAEGDAITIGVYTESSSSAIWGYADNFKLSYINDNDDALTDDTAYIDGHTYKIANGYATLTSPDTDTYLRGADISELNYVESLGAKFHDADGNECDALDVMKNNGINTVRLRLYNQPGNAVTYNGQTYAMPAGFLGEADVLNLARRAKNHGMKIELTFHYSDFWTNGEMQFKPKAWESCTLSELKDSIYVYTKTVLQHMSAQNTAPDYVSLGNEIQSGILFGYYTDASSLPTVNGYCNDMPNLQSLLACGSAAVREVCPDAKIIIHLTMSTGVTASTYSWFFLHMKSLDYDLIGTSYYPYWTNTAPAETIENLISTLNKAGIKKDLMIMETGYAWMRYRPYGRYNGQYEGQLHLNGTAYNEASRDGQKAFIKELQNVIKGNTRICGYYYWDPVMVEQKVDGAWIPTGWVDGGDNQVGNTTLFDYEGFPLPAFDAIREDYIPTEIAIGDTTYPVIRDGQDPSGITSTKMKSVDDGVYYNLCGMRIEHPTRGIYIRNGVKVVKASN